MHAHPPHATQFTEEGFTAAHRQNVEGIVAATAQHVLDTVAANLAAGARRCAGGGERLAAAAGAGGEGRAP